jgi:hypothetical protein
VIPTLSPSTSPIKPEKYNTYQPQGGHEHVVLLYDTLDQHGLLIVICRAGLADC